MSHSTKNSARYNKFPYVFVWSMGLSCQILIEIRFSRQIFENSHVWDFMEIRLVGAELFYAGRRADRHDEAHIRFSQFCEVAKNE